MVVKVLFYVNSVEELKPISERLKKLEDNGFEVAFASDNHSLRAGLAVGKALVVNPKTYQADFTPGLGKVSVKQFLEALS